jgi:DNA-binding XRE family transcriptional regulator
METNAELINTLTDLSAGLPPSLQRELRMVVHKVRYPMAEILTKVPGDSLTERAKALKVSRQTMYVWASEKFRPTKVQAKRVAKVTGVPIEHILNDGFEAGHDTGRKARKKAARVAKGRKTPARPVVRAAARRRSKPADRKRASEA